MTGTAPVVTQNVLSPSTVQVGGTGTWRTVAQDPDAQTETIQRGVVDSQGNRTVFEATLTVSDPLTYESPTCDDPRVQMVVDAGDPTLVHITIT